MAENEKDLVKKGGKYCVAGAPNNESCKNTSYTPDISMHVFPKDAVLRAKWLKFVRRHRVDFGEPISQFATLCSAHFEESCFENSLAFSMGYKRKRSLIKGSIPTRHTVQSEPPQVLTERRKRQVSDFILAYFARNLHCWWKNFMRINVCSKFKLGEEVVREVACPPSYGYVDILKKLLFTLPKSEMKEILERYSAKTPEPLNRQFPERKSKEEAVKSYRARQQKKTTLFPSEAEQSSLQPQPSSDSTTSKTSSSTRRTYKCTVCKQPMRGHKGRCKK